MLSSVSTRRKPISPSREAKLFLFLYLFLYDIGTYLFVILILEWLPVQNPLAKWYIGKQLCKHLSCSQITAEGKKLPCGYKYFFPQRIKKDRQELELQNSTLTLLSSSAFLQLIYSIRLKKRERERRVKFLTLLKKEKDQK